MKSLGGGNKAIDTIKSPHKRETFYEIRNIAHKKENKENIKERLFSQPQFEVTTDFLVRLYVCRIMSLYQGDNVIILLLFFRVVN